MALTDGQAERYSRQIVIPEIGPEGQARLRDASALVVGAGGLGSPIAYYLVAAGVGRIGIMDGDVVELSNLQRQVLHDTGAIGLPKAESAVHRLRSLNPHVEVTPYPARLDGDNGEELVAGYDMVLDGTDNYPARYLINELCVRAGKPYIYGSVFRLEGQASVFDARRGPCYRCLYPQPPGDGQFPTPAQAGVLGATPGVIGCIQATEAIKLVLGVGGSLIGRLLLYDGLEMTFDEMAIAKDPACGACGG